MSFEQMILSFDLPFALVPLLRFTGSQAKMHQHKSSPLVNLLNNSKAVRCWGNKNRGFKDSQDTHKQACILTTVHFSSSSHLTFLCHVIQVSFLSWILGFGTIGINMYFIGTSLAGWMTSGQVPKVWLALVAIIIFPAMIAYVGMLLYLICKAENPLAGYESSRADAATSGNRTPETDSKSGGSNRNEIIEEISA